MEKSDAPFLDTVVEAVRADLLARSRMGIQKYGTTLDRKDLNLKEWLQHTYEETLDQANYLKRSITELEMKDAQSSEGMQIVYYKLFQDSVDAIIEVVGEGEDFARYNAGKSAMRDWFLRRLRNLWQLPEPLSEEVR